MHEHARKLLTNFFVLVLVSEAHSNIILCIQEAVLVMNEQQISKVPHSAKMKLKDHTKQFFQMSSTTVEHQFGKKLSMSSKLIRLFSYNQQMNKK